MVTTLDLGPGGVGSSPEWVPIFYEARSRLHRAYLKPCIGFGGSRVPEQLGCNWGM